MGNILSSKKKEQISGSGSLSSSVTSVSSPSTAIVAAAPRPGDEERQALLVLADGSHAVVNTASLETLLQYVNSHPAPFSKSWLPNISLGVPAVACTWMYITPSIKAGLAQAGIPGAILQTLGNTSMAALVVFNIGGNFVELLRSARDAAVFSKHAHLATLEKQQNYAEKAISWLRKMQLDVPILSLCVACPYLAVALYSKYKDWEGEPDYVVAIKATVTYLVNAITHTLPISFILNIPWLNFLLMDVLAAPLTLPLKGIRAWYNSCLNSEKRAGKRLAEIKLKQQTLLQMHLSRLFYSLAERIKEQGFQGRGCCFTPKQLKMITNANSPHAMLDMLEGFLQRYPEMSHTSNSAASSVCHNIVEWDRKGCWCGVGAVLTGASVAGYIKVNYDVFNEMFGGRVPLTVAALIFPVVTTEVMTFYFGYQGFKGAYDLLVSFLRCHAKTPYPFKLNPILSGVFLGITYFLNCFGYGTALQLVDDTFPETTFVGVHKVLDPIVIAGLLTYGFINMAQLLEKLVEPVAKRFGSVEQKNLLEVVSFLKRTAALIERMKPEQVEQLLKNTPEQNLKALRLDKSATSEVTISETKQIATLPQSCCRRPWNCCSGLFNHKTNIVVQHEPAIAASERDPLLAGSSGSVNENGSSNVPVPSAIAALN